MQNILTLVFVLVLIVSCVEKRNNSSNRPVETDSNNSCGQLDGTTYKYVGWEGMDEESALPDSSTFTILFHCVNDSLKGFMFGPEPMEEHGMYYYKAGLDSLRVDKDIISFSLVLGALYYKPITLNNYNKDMSKYDSGGSNERRFFKGRMAGDSLELSCDSPDGVCYDKVMKFKKQVRNK